MLTRRHYMKRSAIRKVSAKGRRRQREWQASFKQNIAADGDCCRYPGCIATATDPHHRLPRSRGGTDEPENIVPLCRAHHEAVHADPATAIVLGLLRRTPAKGDV